MGTERLSFEDFSGGDIGRQRPEMADVNTFRAVNAWAYPSGGLGPRPPAQAITLTGLPQQKLNVFIVMRAGSGIIYVFAFSDGTIYRVPAATGVAELVGTAANVPVAAATSGDFVFFVSASGLGCYITTSGGISTSEAPQGQYVAMFGERLMVSDPLVGLTYASKPGEHNLFPAANSFRIGSTNEAVVGLYVQRNTLVMPKRYGDIWVMRGVPTVNETLRPEDRSSPHHLIWRAPGAVVNQSNLWFCVGRQMVRFTGAQALTEERPDLPALSGYNSFPWSDNLGAVLPLVEDDEFLLVGTMDKTGSTDVKQVWFQARRPLDRWTRHLLPTDEFHVTASSTTGLGVSVWTSEAVRVDYFLQGVALICTGSDTSGNSGRTPRLYALLSQQEYPHLPVGSITNPLATVATLNDGDSGAPVVADAYKEHWDPKGRRLTVTSVAVDYSYNPAIGASATYNRFDLTVESLLSPGASAAGTSATHSFEPSVAGPTPDGSPMVRSEERFQFGDQGSGAGFRLHFANWRGILVHRIQVYVDVAEQVR